MSTLNFFELCYIPLIFVLFQKYLVKDALLNFVSGKHGGIIGKKANVRTQVERVSTDRRPLPL